VVERSSGIAKKRRSEEMDKEIKGNVAKRRNEDVTKRWGDGGGGTKKRMVMFLTPLAETNK